MLYLSQMLGKKVLDSSGTEIGRISDLAISTGEVFPRITALAFLGPSRTPFMVSWRKYVESFDDDKIELNVPSPDIRFSYLQPDELLLARDLLNKQIVDTQGLKVVRVNDLKLSLSGRQLRLLGAEVGLRGILRGLSPSLERLVQGAAKAVGRDLEENIIAWNYMELVDRDLSAVKLSISHKRLHELHPADVADILEQLDPQQRGRVFDHLDSQQAAETMSELEDEYQADIIDDLSERRASELLAQMSPDDAADILGDLPYEKAEKLLWLMGVQDQRRIRSLLGYKERTAGGIMTPQFIAVQEDTTVGDAIEYIRSMGEKVDTVHYIYTLDVEGKLSGALSLRSLVLADISSSVFDLATRDLITASPEDDQEEVADDISKYDLLAMPVVDETGVLLGIVTVDDALDVLEEEHSEDLQIAGATVMKHEEGGSVGSFALWLLRKELWLILWAIISTLIVMSGLLGPLVGALLFMPIVLLVADDISAYSINDLIEYSGSNESMRSVVALLIRNAVVGLFAGALALLLFLMFSSALQLNVELFASGTTLSMLSYSLGATVLACFIIIMAGVLITVRARKRLDKGKAFSSMIITFVLMLSGVLIQLLLSYGAIRLFV